MAGAAPYDAKHIAETDPFESSATGTTTVDGKQVAVLAAERRRALGATPIGPTLAAPLLPGADSQGRDAMARRSIAGGPRSTLGIAAGLLTHPDRALLGLAAGFFGGWIDAIISRGLDVLSAFPVYLLAIALATVPPTQGLTIGPVPVEPASPPAADPDHRRHRRAHVARPVRGEAFSVGEREFIEAVIARGA